MGKIEWRRETDESKGKANSSEKGQDFLREVWRPVCRDNEEEVPLKEKVCEIRKAIGMHCASPVPQEGLELSASLVDYDLDNIGYSL